MLQVYLLSFAVEWNGRMERLKVAGKKGKATTTIDPRQIQRMNDHAEVLFGKDHLYEPNAISPLQPPTKGEEEELLGVEYAYSQSTVSSFSSKDYYIQGGENSHLSCNEQAYNTNGYCGKSLNNKMKNKNNGINE